MSLRSPDELMAAAKTEMLAGREPESPEDYGLIVNFIACNVVPEIALSVSTLMRSMYDMPLSWEQVDAIVAFQLSQRKGGDATIGHEQIVFNSPGDMFTGEFLDSEVIVPDTSKPETRYMQLRFRDPDGSIKVTKVIRPPAR